MSLYLVKKNQKTKRLKDFISLSKNFENVSIGKDGMYAEKCVQLDCQQASGEKIYNARGFCGATIAVADGGGVYQKLADNLEKIGSIIDNENVTIADFDDNGKKRYLLLGENAAYLCEDATLTEVNIPYGTHAALVGETLFVANDCVLKFGEKSAIEARNTAFYSNNIIEFPARAGKIIELIPLGKELVIVCKYAIYILSALGEKIAYNLSSIQSEHINVAENSVAKIGDGIYFISDRRLKVLKNNRVTDCGCDYEINAQKVLSCAATGTCYNVIFQNQSDYLNTLMSFDIAKERVFITRGRFNKIDCNSNLFADNGIYLLSDSVGEGIVSYWQSKNFDFDCADKKVFSSMSVITDSPLEVVLLGDFGQKRLKFNSGYTRKKINLKSGGLSFELHADKGFNLSYVDFEYSIMERK